jgi:hypothetical protein
MRPHNTEITVHLAPKSLSTLLRNHCPPCSEITVQKLLKSLSTSGRDPQTVFLRTAFTLRSSEPG